MGSLMSVPAIIASFFAKASKRRPSAFPKKFRVKHNHLTREGLAVLKDEVVSADAARRQQNLHNHSIVEAHYEGSLLRADGGVSFCKLTPNIGTCVMLVPVRVSRQSSWTDTAVYVPEGLLEPVP